MIHYFRESFYDPIDGTLRKIKSIMPSKLDSAQTVLFLINLVAAKRDFSLSVIEHNYDEPERNMLDPYFHHVNWHTGYLYLHWNIRNVNFVFTVIEHRYSTLGGEPNNIDDNKKFDLSRILIDICGVNYSEYPRLERFIRKNSYRRWIFWLARKKPPHLNGSTILVITNRHSERSMSSRTLLNVRTMTNYLRIRLGGRCTVAACRLLLISLPRTRLSL